MGCRGPNLLLNKSRSIHWKIPLFRSFGPAKSACGRPDDIPSARKLAAISYDDRDDFSACFSVFFFGGRFLPKAKKNL